MAKILVVDDDAEFLDSVVAVLEDKGHQVATARNGADGFRQAKENKPDLMLLDVMMTTDSEGFEVARRLHEEEDTKNLPVIIVTGIRKAKSLPFSFEPDADWLPVKAVLEKPVKPEALLRNVEKALM
jgi:two-component system, OmpR family, alkaline phosphatase synthesis response regulator PhoP